MNYREYTKQSGIAGVHEKFFGQFVTPETKSYLARKLAKYPRDQWLDFAVVPLHVWDQIVQGYNPDRRPSFWPRYYPIMPYNHQRARHLGLWHEPASYQCIAREAVRQILHED